MFCPLCLSEYRDGFTECGDCHIALVAASEEASSGRVRLWKGTRQSKLDRILGELDGANIPCHFKETVDNVPSITLLGIPIGPPRSTFEYEVWIFRKDLDRARLLSCGT